MAVAQRGDVWPDERLGCVKMGFGDQRDAEGGLLRLFICRACASEASLPILDLACDLLHAGARALLSAGPGGGEPPSQPPRGLQRIAEAPRIRTQQNKSRPRRTRRG